ncbi:DUF1189 domain-containing protein [Effusibacillus dendaii]|uniref:DUF1189 domain-containing protein n=1 Tax=Effusibacillus dendaii TaxID=2743772 RepID=A0A7I8D9F7_9BACL|nr:DUF1189 domain-containing protein [Effusibacillus dendaii]BCJ86637.1 hypothetical protein skT53_16220 [Effusibacillus dendaii]
MRTIWNSICRPSAYQRLTQQKLWRSLLSLTVFFTLLAAIHVSLMANAARPILSFVETDFPAKMPNFSYNGNELQMQETSPVLLTDKNGYRVIVDTSATPPEQSIRHTANGLIFGKTTLYTVSQGVQQSYTYKQLMLPPFNKQDVIQITPLLKPFFIMGMLVWVLFQLIGNFLAITLFSLISYLFGGLQKIRLSFREAWLIAAFAMIPASLIEFLNSFLQSGYLTLAYWVAIFTYIHHGLNSFKQRTAG